MRKRNTNADQKEQGLAITFTTVPKGLMVSLPGEKEEEILMRTKGPGHGLAHHHIPKEA